MIEFISKHFQAQILNVYRIISIGILLSIVFGVLGYVSLLIFYALNTSWAVPVILSPSQEKVLAFQPQVASIEAQLRQQELTLATYQVAYNGKMEQLTQTRQHLERFRQAKDSEIAHVVAKGRESQKQFEWLQRQIADDQQAGFLTKYDAHRESIALDAYALTFMMQEEQLEANVAQLEIDTKMAELNIKAIRETLTEDQRILAVTKDSPKYKALTHSVTVAFVPYANLGSAKIGSPVFDCYMQIFGCQNVGKIVNIYGAEEYGIHPLFRTDAKGKMIEISFTKADSSMSRVIFLNSKPLLL